MKKKTIMLFTTIILLFSVYMVAAQTTIPEAPTGFNIIESTRRDPSILPNRTVEAIAGNITALSLHGMTTTRSWFGVYGNVTGTLVLSNGNNQVMYNWSVANPRGQVYATRAPDEEGLIRWNEVRCYNYSIVGQAYYTLADFHTELGINGALDQDSVNRTFMHATFDVESNPLANFHSGFYVGTRNIAANTCPATSMFDDSGQQNFTKFQQVLLYNHGFYDDAVAAGQQENPAFQASVIYASRIENTNVLGFDGSDMDFQMLLGENGHQGNTDTTTYYFYVELE